MYAIYSNIGGQHFPYKFATKTESDAQEMILSIAEEDWYLYNHIIFWTYDGISDKFYKTLKEFGSYGYYEVKIID